MNLPPVVCNASPLIALAQIGQLDLLQALFVIVLVPPGAAMEAAPSVILPSWMTVTALQQPLPEPIRDAALGLGESEAIALALEVGARYVVLDDLGARKLAVTLGVPVIGTLGLLLAAKSHGLIAAVRPHMDSLLAHNFHMHPSLYDLVLRSAGEEK